MPHMKPMNWLFLYLMFFLTYILMLILLYFLFIYCPQNKPQKNSLLKYHWNWDWL